MRKWLRAVGWTGLGLVVGLGLALYLGWVAWPTEFTEADPSILRDEYRRDYTLMIANAYMLDGDLPAARRRLYSLGQEAPDQWLLKMTIDAILSGRDEATVILPLVKLAHDLGLNSPAMVPYLDRIDNERTEDVQE